MFTQYIEIFACKKRVFLLSNVDCFVIQHLEMLQCMDIQLSDL